jgi:hypothetical protein
MIVSLSLSTPREVDTSPRWLAHVVMRDELTLTHESLKGGDGEAR